MEKKKQSESPSEGSARSESTAYTNRILLVDDEQDVIDIFTEDLRHYGLEADGFTSPFAAVDHFELNPTRYAMVISDIKMPKMNGFEFVREIRRINPHVHVLFITAFEVNMSEFEKVLPSIAIDGFIKKPITPGKLAETIKHHLALVSDRNRTAA